MNNTAPRPICFMIMPFGTKKTDVQPDTGPAEINFDLLWEKAYRPTIEQLGYEPVRADQEVGALIIHEMLERLYFADLVLADMTIPNGNVYYEVGIRHACKKVGCVLLAADWSKQLFDLAQTRTARYPLPVGIVDDAAAAAIRKSIEPAIKKLMRGDAPMWEVLKGYPARVDESRASTMRQHLTGLAAFQSRISSVRAAPGEAQGAMLKKLVEEARNSPLAAVVHSLLNLGRELGEWEEVLELIKHLENSEPPIAAQPEVVELKSLAQSKLGEHLESIGSLEQLIVSQGRTSEREGLLGGRYKELYAKSAGSDKARYLNEAIKHYELGMMADLNDFFPSSNLPRLYRARGLPEDLAKANSVIELITFACRRAEQAVSAEPWLKPAQLALAFDKQDASLAQTYYRQMVVEGGAGWKLKSLLRDLETSLGQVADRGAQEELRTIYSQIEALAAS